VEQLPEGLLGRAVRRPVVGQVEVRYPEVEGAPEDRAAALERSRGAEVPPEGEIGGSFRPLRPLRR
jgi:hypothetical protein